MFPSTDWLPLIGLLSILLTCVNSQDILGCGGFVKSEVEINFSLVEVKLYTRQGSLKYRTDCAPNTGYFMIPVYNRGEYTLRVEPPPGWTFEPESVDLFIDGTTDRCSRGEDINFLFTGFGIIGTVISSSQTEGPSGVSLTLTKVNSAKVLKETTSEEGGAYSFDKVLPGEYTVTAQHPTWTFEKSSVQVTVGSETGKAGTTISIKGYDVSGHVYSEGEPIRGVNFILYSATVRPKQVSNCDKGSVPGLSAKQTTGLICHVVSDKDGGFTFPTLPYGDYKLVPFYKGDHITFDVVPAEREFTVRHDSVIFKEAFQVAGFSVQGRVLKSTKGTGIAGARVFLNSKEQAVTKGDGSYHLDSMKAGTYTLKVTADHVFFDPTIVKVTPNTPQLPDVIATRFSLCGRVMIDKIPEGLSQVPRQRQVTVRSSAPTSKVITLNTDVEGHFCAEVEPGMYVIEVSLADNEKSAGLKLAPPQVEVKIVDSASMTTVFSQFRAKVEGKVNCLERCGLHQVSLTAVGRSAEKRMAQVDGSGKSATYQFTDVMPGKYKVTLLNEAWCWKEKTLEIEIVDRDLEDVTFTQSGYILSCSLSHDITLNFAQEKKPGNVGSIKLSKGINKMCLAQPGLYQLTPDSCHRFEQDTYTYDTSVPSVLTMSAVKHLTEGVVVTHDFCGDIMVTIKSSVEGEVPVTLGPLTSDKEQLRPKDPKAKKLQGPFTHRFMYWARSGEKLDISVSSAELLFQPLVAQVTVHGESCPGVVASFEGRQGVFISGQIVPVLSGVRVTITDRSDEQDQITMETDEKGTYRVGPLQGGREYGVSAEKEGYIFSDVPDKLGHFMAFKLAEINVKVVDKVGNGLQGVLLSLSGSNQYRSNKLSSTDGSMAFLGLSPGQYFLRPMMKEYRFEPASQMIDVSEGATINFNIAGTRVAFSCYGSVMSLNGEAEPDVIVEAVGLGPDSCTQLQEESKSEVDGSFRIRGLQPSCEYVVRLRSGEVNQHIERSAANVKSVMVEDRDLTSVNIVAFRRLNQLDLSGNVVTSPEHVPTLKVHLFREANPDSPVHSVSLGHTPFFYLPSLTIDNQNYFVRLDSSLARLAYEFTQPEISFTANMSYHHLTFTFKPKHKLIDQDLNHSSFLLLPFMLLIIFIGYHYKKMLPLLAATASNIQSLMTPQPSSSSSSATSNTGASLQISPELLADLSTSKKKQKVRRA